MLNRDYRDIVTGLLLAALGVTAVAYSVSHYSVGTITRMGPGMVPASLGSLLAIFGAIIAAPAFFREGTGLEFRILTPLLVLVSILVFALTITAFGLIPAIFLSTIVASMAELTLRPFRSVVLAAALCLLAYLIFSVGLGLPMPLFAWSL